MYLCILGRLPKLSLAELESVYGTANISPLAGNLCTVDTPSFDLDRLGGTLKAGKIITTTPLSHLKSLPKGKLTIGVSDYRQGATAHSAQTEALKLKNILRRSGYSVRVVPNQSSAALSSATSHHNKLGLAPNKIEFLYTQKFVAVSIGAQNITAYSRRDFSRPKRDAKVGMLPPKLAQILINLAQPKKSILDPFCGTGVIGQEALLAGFSFYGTDINPKMIEYTTANLNWLHTKTPEKIFTVEVGDATTHHWSQPFDAVASEIFLGQPLSRPPTDKTLTHFKQEIHSLLYHFLHNLKPQLAPDTTISLAIPAWKREDGSYSRLKVLDILDELGYNYARFKYSEQSDLLYYREDQIVAREIIVLRSK